MVVKNLNPNALASATSVSFQQRIQNTGAVARDEKILVIGNYQDGKTAVENIITQFTNSDDVATVYGFGSPLHRMAMKLFPLDGNGSKVSTYFLPVNGNGTGQITNINIKGNPTKNFTCYLRFKELEFEAPADVVGKIATNYQLNPAQAPRKIDINVFNKVLVPFTILKNSTEIEILNSIKKVLDTYIEVPFVATISTVETKNILSLVSKYKGETAKFEVDFVDGDGQVITTVDYGFVFEQINKEEAAGIVNIKNTLDVITAELEITRVVSQFNDSSSLDLLKDKFSSFRDGLIAQWVLCYTGRTFKESELVPNTVNIAELIEFGDNRRLDSVNVIIAGDYGDLRPLNYNERDQLLKAGISNLEPLAVGGYKIGDLVTMYHPIGQKFPLFRYDRDITLIGNIANDLMYTFRDSLEWKSIIIVDEKLTTNNPFARSIKDVKASLDTRLRLYGNNAWIADVDSAIENSVVHLDNSNPNRFNINPSFDLSGVGNIFDITNLVGFYFGSSL